MKRSDNVVWLRPPDRHERPHGLARALVVGGILTGLAAIAQTLVVALSAL